MTPLPLRGSDAYVLYVCPLATTTIALASLGPPFPLARSVVRSSQFPMGGAKNDARTQKQRWINSQDPDLLGHLGSLSMTSKSLEDRDPTFRDLDSDLQKESDLQDPNVSDPTHLYPEGSRRGSESLHHCIKEQGTRARCIRIGGRERKADQYPISSHNRQPT